MTFSRTALATLIFYILALGFINPASAAKCVSLGCSAGQIILPCANGYKVLPKTITCVGRFAGSYTCCQTDAAAAKESAKNTVAKKSDFDRRVEAYKCQQLYCAKVCTDKESMQFCRPKEQSYNVCKAKCSRLAGVKCFGC